MSMGLHEDHLHMFWIAILQFALQITTTMLVLAQTVKFALVVLKGDVGKTRQWTVSLTIAATLFVCGKLRVCVVKSRSRVSGIGLRRVSLPVDRHGISHIRLKAISIKLTRERVHSQRSRSNRSSDAGACGGGKLGTERGSAGLKSGLNGRLLLLLLLLLLRQMAIVNLTLGRLLSHRVVLLTRDGIWRNSTQAGIVLMEMLRMGIWRSDITAVRQTISLHGGKIIGRIRGLQRGRSVGGLIMVDMAITVDSIPIATEADLQRVTSEVAIGRDVVHRLFAWGASQLLLDTEHIQRVLGQTLVR